MTLKPLSKKGSVKDIKDMEKHWTALQDTFNSITGLISEGLMSTLTLITGPDRKPSTDKFPYVEI